MTVLSKQEEREIATKLAAIITTLAEFPGGCTETTAYLALGSNLTEWDLLKSILSQGGYLTFKGNRVQITAKGKIVAAGIMSQMPKEA